MVSAGGAGLGASEPEPGLANAVSCCGGGVERESAMSRKYSKAASNKVKRAMHERKNDTIKSGRSGKKVTSRKQAVAIGLSEARKEGKKVPKKRSSGKK